MTSYLIDFKNETGDSEIQDYLNTYQCTQIKIFNQLNKTYHVNSDSQPPLTDIVSSVINDDDSHLQLQTTVEIPIRPSTSSISIDSNDAHNWWKLYSVSNIDLDQQSINVNKFGQGVNVYMVDSGIDLTHSEFNGQDINLIFSFTGEFSDNNGHGTALSSVIIGNTCGLTDATLNVVKIFDQNIPTKQSDLLSALNAILEDAEISSNKVSIVNLSWSIPKNSFIESKIQCLIDAGLIVVVSAGNSGIPISDVTPASMHGAFVIGSYGENFTPSDFSNYSNSIISVTPNLTNFGQLYSWAPGENIYVATVGNNGYSMASGTSISTAIYSGSFAYNLSQRLTTAGNLPASFKKNNGIGIPDQDSLSYADRRNLLDLSDIRYSSSSNRICSYLDLYSGLKVDPLIILEQELKIKCRPGKFLSKTFIIRNVVQSYEILGNLPAGVTIDDTYININILDEPVSTQHIDQYLIPIKINLRESSTPIYKNIEIVLIGSLFDPSILPPNDPLIDITLELNCYNTNIGSCFSGTCSGQGPLGGQQVCVPSGKQCVCTSV